MKAKIGAPNYRRRILFEVILEEVQVGRAQVTSFLNGSPSELVVCMSAKAVQDPLFKEILLRAAANANDPEFKKELEKSTFRYGDN